MTAPNEAVISRRHWFPVLSWGLFVLGSIGGMYLQVHFHKFLNFDTLAYLDIAREYAEGRWVRAINGCWSPLYSWLIALFQSAGMDPLVTCYALNFAAAAGCLFFIQNLSRRLIPSRVFRYVLQGFLLILLLYSSMSTLTPDLLSTLACLWFLYLIIHEQSGWKMLVFPALAAAFMYWAKLYNFAFLQLFFPVAALYQVYLKKRQQAWRIFRIWLLSLAFSAPWIMLLSRQEGRLVFSTTGRYAYNQVSPYYEGDYPIYDTLFAPPYPEARSFLVNPVHTLDQYGWSPFDSRELFIYQLSLIRDSLNKLLQYTDRFRLGWLFVLGFLLYRRFATREERRKLALPPEAGYLWLFLLIYPLLYLPLFMVDRYVIICTFLFSFLLFMYAGKLWAFTKFKKLILAVVMLLVGAGFFPMVKSLNNKILQNSGEYNYYRSFYLELDEFAMLKGKNFAADPETALEAVQYCYYLEARYFASWHQESGDFLRKQGIDYLLTGHELKMSNGFQLRARAALSGKTLYLYETTGAGYDLNGSLNGTPLR